MTDSQIDFEKGFKRLEEILEQMNRGNTSLDHSLALYEEADKLIEKITSKLNTSQAKVEMLIKKRNGDLELNESGHATAAEFELKE